MATSTTDADGQSRPTWVVRELLTFAVLLGVGLYVVALATRDGDLAGLAVLLSVSGAVGSMGLGFLVRNVA